MKQIKLIVLSAILTLGAVFAIFNTSCTKNVCGATTCLNRGQCRGGICVCPTIAGKPIGVTGANCEIVYRNTYLGVYEGKPPYDTVGDSTHLLQFIPDETDTMDYTTMFVIWQDTTRAPVIKLPVQLYNITASAASFSVVPTRNGDYMYRGEGAINGVTANMRLVETHDTGTIATLHFNNYIK